MNTRNLKREFNIPDNIKFNDLPKGLLVKTYLQSKAAIVCQLDLDYFMLWVENGNFIKVSLVDILCSEKMIKYKAKKFQAFIEKHRIKSKPNWPSTNIGLGRWMTYDEVTATQPMYSIPTDVSEALAGIRSGE